MSALKDAKVAQAIEIKEKLENAGSFVLIGYQGINVADDTALRVAFRDAGVEYHVYKNRILKIALNNLGYTEFDEALNGATSIAIATNDDIAAPARIIVDKAKTNNKLIVKCGCVEKRYLDVDGCKQLATLPTKEGLISQVLGLLQAPIAGLARCIAAIKDEKEKA
ncbi:MAG: 50S ribosomal protein L10 [Clostridia bacterium]|nr:50S ribosomal protein L10 [Clostridia bacterium]